MGFTALHRVLGRPPGPLTDDMLDTAVANGVTETDDLDWKSELPPAKGLTQTDFPKDVAAMANSGGGLIVFGVRETQKAATGRADVGEVDEAYERALCSAPITAISPPVFGVTVHRLGDVGRRAVVVEVPASVDGPHLIFRNEYFGAPVRNGSDTVWMKERQIEAMYRARFDERRHMNEALDGLFAEAAAGRDTGRRAWFIAVARPRIPRVGGERPASGAARSLFEAAGKLALGFANRSGVHPLESVDRLNPRPGLRRWVAANTALGERSAWREAWASIHHDGSVTLAAAIGGHRNRSDSHLKGQQVRSTAVECAVADLMALLRVTATSMGATEYDVSVGIEWSGEAPLTLLHVDSYGDNDSHAIPIHGYARVKTTVVADAGDADFHWQVHDLAQDCINQGGIPDVALIRPPARED